MRIREHHRASSNFFASDNELWNGVPQVGVEALIATFDDKKALIQALKKNLRCCLRLEMNKLPSQGVINPKKYERDLKNGFHQRPKASSLIVL